MSFNMAEASARITAQTEGQEKITALSSAVKDLSAQVKLFAAQAGVGGSQAAQLAAGAQKAAQGLNTMGGSASLATGHMQKLSASAGQQRAAMQGLSYQISDVATSFAGGINPMVIFAQQGSQVIQAIAMMQGEASGLIGFLSGPWGAVLMGATAILGTMIPKLMDTSEQIDKVKVSSFALHDAQGILGGIFDMTTGKMKDQTGAAMALAKAQIILAQATSQKNLATARSQIADSAAKQWEIGGGMGGGLYIGRAAPITAQVESQFRNGMIDASGAIESLRRMQQAGRITMDTFAQLSAAYANTAVETKNLETLNKAQESLLTGKLNPALMEATKHHTKHRHALTEAEKAAKRWAQAQQEMNDLILRGNGILDQRIEKLSQMGSLAPKMIGAPEASNQTLWEQLSASNASALDLFEKSKSPMQKGIESYKASIADTGKSVAETWTKSLKATEDALTNFVVTGKLSFKDLANSIISDLARIAIQKMILGPIMKAFGFADGGVFSGGSVVAHANGGVFGGGVQAFASGGVVGRPTLFPMSGGRTGLMGEAAPEAIMPLRRLSNGRLGVETAGGGGNTTVAVSVDATGSKVQGDSGSANELGRVIGQAVQAELIRQRRPGGLLAA